jgi:hypothetical protein
MAQGGGCSWRTVPVIVSLLAAPTLTAQTVPTWEELEARQARLASIDIRIGDVFDPSRPHENHWLGRLANALHIKTREQVVRRELHFQAGDVVNARLIHEAERNLRAFRFLKDAEIEPQLDATGAVHAVVRTQDAWTLKLSAGVSQVGGQRDFGFALHEANLLGFGKDLVLAHEKTPERSIDTLHYQDPQFLGSQWTFASRYQVLSDGKTRLLELARPYRGLDTPWSMTFSGSSSDSVQTVYNLKQTAYTFRYQREAVLLEGSWAATVAGDRAVRVGGGLDFKRTRFGPVQSQDAGDLPAPQPQDRQLQGFHLAWSLFDDQFRVFQNLAGMVHSEDFNLGWEAQLSVGSYLGDMGSDVTAPFFRGSVSKGWIPGADSLLLLRTQASARHEADGWQNASLETSLTAYHQGFRAQTQAAYLQVDAVHRPDPENFLYLGGLDGMRGYANNLLLGDRRWMASLEERLNTTVNWLGILQLGFVAYADGGAIRRSDTGRWSRTYLDVGGGLRLGDLKSSIGRVFLLTVAFPLVRDPGTEHHQILVGNIVKF